jgi:hypothetical protein
MKLSARTTFVSAIGVVAATAATLGPAQAAPDPGRGTCDKVYVTHWQHDADTMRVRWNVTRCSPAAAPRIQYVVQRNSKTLANGFFDCPWENLACTMTRNYNDPGGSQSWDAFGRLYETGDPSTLLTYVDWTS